MTARNPMTALIYTDSAAANRVLRDGVHEMRATGAQLAGVVQRADPRPGRTSCDVYLESLSGDESTLISEDRGPGASGCCLDPGALLRAMQSIESALRDRPDRLILNKFGKTEAEGGGFRPLIAQAMELGVPVLIAVPQQNADSWRAFTGDMAREVYLDTFDGAVLAAMLALIDGPRVTA